MIPLLILMLKTTGLTDALASISNLANVYEVVGDNDLKPTLSKFKKIKLTKYKNLAKSINYINVRATRFLIFETRVTFTQLS